MPVADRKLRVFLCYASQDKPIVRELYQRLLAEDWIDPWLDEEKLLPGQDWNMEIEKAVEAADAVIVCLSNNSVTKDGYVQKELRFVLNIADEKPEETIFVIPLRFDDCLIPRRLQNWQYVDYFPKTRQKVYLRVLQSLQTIASRLGLNSSMSNQKTVLLSSLSLEERVLDTQPIRKPRNIDFIGQVYLPDGISLAALLVLESDQVDLVGTWIPIQKARVTLGRSPENDIVFPNDITVSRQHAIIELYNGKWILREIILAAEDGEQQIPINGLWVNAHKIHTAVSIVTADKIRLGNLRLHFQSLG